MEGRKESEVSRKRPRKAGVVALLVLGAALALALVSASSGSTGSQAGNSREAVGDQRPARGSARCTPRRRRRSSTRSSRRRCSRRTRCRATSRWPDSVAPTGRSTWHWRSSAGRTTAARPGRSGKLKVAYLEQFGENVYRQMSKMEFILQALTYPQVGEIIYSSAHVGLQQGVRRLEGGNRPGCRPDRHLSGLRRRDDPGDEGGDRRRNPRRDVCLGLRQRSRQELPDGRR